MKKFISFLFLLVLLVVASLALLLRNDFDKISQSREAFSSTLKARVDEAVYSSPRPIRLFLFNNMPGLFPIAYACETHENGGKQTLIPGDDIVATNAEIDFTCPNGVGGMVSIGSRVRILPLQGIPGLELVNGSLRLSFKTEAPTIYTEYFRLALKGKPELTRMAIGFGPDGYVIGCRSGSFEGELTALPGSEQKKNYLLTTDCSAQLKWSPSLPATHLMPGDLLAVADLGKERQDWAPQDMDSRLATLDMIPRNNPTMAAKLDAVPASQDTIKLSWQSNAPEGLYYCTLYTQENTRAAPKVAHQFQAQASAGELALLKGFQKFWISMNCSLEQNKFSPEFDLSNSFTSNIIAPLM